MAFEVPTPGVTVLFGPSGAGKSTIISAAAGLLRPDECRIVVDGQVLADTASGVWLPPERRRIGLVFQDARLFPHMSVATNLRFGLRRAAPGPVRFDEVVELLGIGALLARRPHTLSGGERQRVAIGRALLAQPHLLLMDEPLASLDAARKAEIMPYLTRLKTALKLPILYVTHALDEVAQLADSLVLIEAGRVVGCGPLSEIAARADLPLAQRDDAGALLLCRVAEHDTGARAVTPGRRRRDVLGAAAGCATRCRTPRAHTGARGDPGRQAARCHQPAQRRARQGAPDQRAMRRGDRSWWRSPCQAAR